MRQDSLKDSERNEGDGGRQGGEEEIADKTEEDEWAFPVKSKEKKGGAELLVGKRRKGRNDKI